MRDERDAAAHLGTELRRARQQCRMRQRDVAARIDCSQSMISRMELGAGAHMPLASWSAAAQAVDRRLIVDIVHPHADPPRNDALGLRCHRALTRVARDGDWSAVTEIRSRMGHEEIETILRRADHSVVVHAWDVVTRVAARVDLLQTSMDRERASDSRTSVHGLVIVPATGGNRRRMTEEQSLLRRSMPGLAARWFASLRNEHRPVPSEAGILWLDRYGARLLPAPLLPGWIWVTPDHASRVLR